MTDRSCDEMNRAARAVKNPGESQWVPDMRYAGQTSPAMKMDRERGGSGRAWISGRVGPVSSIPGRVPGSSSSGNGSGTGGSGFETESGENEDPGWASPYSTVGKPDGKSGSYA